MKTSAYHKPPVLSVNSASADSFNYGKRFIPEEWGLAPRYVPTKETYDRMISTAHNSETRTTCLSPFDIALLSKGPIASAAGRYTLSRRFHSIFVTA